MLDRVLAGFLDREVAVAGALDDARAGAFALRVELSGVGDVFGEQFEDAFLMLRGEKPGCGPGRG
ncbi:MAG: hypothetical protein ACRDNW_23455 [Trebonia sp.]